jgi:CheY-like chemotaxis protein
MDIAVTASKTINLHQEMNKMTKKKNCQMLWVDDDIFEIEYLLYPLEKDGYKIEKIRYLPEAYEKLKLNSNYDLIVLDLIMPPTDCYGEIPEWLVQEHPNGANGIKLLIQMREELKIQIPVLILSVVPDAIEEMNIGNKYNPLDFIHKSSHQIQDAIEKLREILEQGEIN